MASGSKIDEGDAGMMAEVAASHEEVPEVEHHRDVVAVPNELHDGCEQKQDYPESIKKRKDTKGSAHIEVPEEVFALQRVVEDTCDEKSGENKE